MILIVISCSLVQLALGLHEARSSAHLGIEVVPAPRSLISSKTDLQRRLRVCNAYTSTTPLHLVHHRGKETKVNLTEHGPLAYKGCQDYASELGRRDSIWFWMHNKPIGVFSVTALPRRDALLLLVAHRRSPESSTLAFTSHVYASLLNAQVAVLDTFKGESSKKVMIRDLADDAANKSKQERLPYSTVVAINPGKYECMLIGESQKTAKRAALVGLNRENYVVLRVGEEKNVAFPEELIVYPGPSGDAVRHSGLPHLALWLFAAALCHLL